MVKINRKAGYKTLSVKLLGAKNTAMSDVNPNDMTLIRGNGNFEIISSKALIRSNNCLINSLALLIDTVLRRIKTVLRSKKFS